MATITGTRGPGGRLPLVSLGSPTGYKFVAITTPFVLVLGYVNRTSLDTLNVISVVAPAVLIVGIARLHPRPLWPWLSLVATLVLFGLGIVLRDHYETLGNLTKTRTIIPDLATMPGYLFLASGLGGFAVFRTRSTKNRLGVVSDSVIASLALFACLYVFLIEPVLSRYHAPESVRVILVCYPALSMFIVSLTIQLAFGVSRQRSVAERLLLASMFMMFTGDMVDMFGELGDVTTLWMFVLPYAMAYLALMGCVLDPSMRQIAEPSTATRPDWTISRIALIAIAFVVPALIFLQQHTWTPGERFMLFGIIIALMGTAILQIVRALFALRHSEDLLRLQALHDALTDLPNRRYLENYLAAADVDGRPNDIALFFIDLDRFKLINDTRGHTHGDVLLSEIANRLRVNVNDEDLVARIGGDEFVVVVQQAQDIEKAREYANRLRNCLSEAISIDGSEFYVTASVGITYKSAQAGVFDPDTLLREADTAMYQAKEAGRNAVALYDDSMRAQLQQRVEIEHDLRNALSRNEFYVVYQPIVAMGSKKVVGLEALIRWAHPTLGVLLPPRFIPLAEESGLITELGSYVLDESLRQLTICRSRPGLEDLTIAVNLSAIQLRDPLFVQGVGRALDAHQLPGSTLCLELTESAMMEDLDGAVEAFSRLRRLGIQISIDDFGTEYSSLAYLQRLPVDSLKVDRSFVAPLEHEDTASESLVAAIVAMARALKIATIAEGVETVAQSQRLVKLGIDSAQGYLFARPVRSEMLIDVIELILDSQHDAHLVDTSVDGQRASV